MNIRYPLYEGVYRILTNKSVKDMRKKSVNTLLVFGVVVAIILLMIWLFLGTTLVEDTSTEITPVPIEQTN